MRLLISFLLTIVVSTKASDINLESLDKIRKIYYNSVEDERYIDSLKMYIDEFRQISPPEHESLLLAYEGAISSVKAKHAFWPFTKMSYLNESMDTIKKAILLDEDNLEIRFVRFSILHYVPGILGYSDELEKDLIKIVELLRDENYSGLPLDIVNGISSFLIETDRLNETQLKLIDSKRILSNNQ